MEMLTNGVYDMIMRGVDLVNKKHQDASLEMQKDMILKYIDSHWLDRMETMISLKNSGSMQMLSQKDPFMVYKQELAKAYMLMSIELYESIFKVYAVMCKTLIAD